MLTPLPATLAAGDQSQRHRSPGATRMLRRKVSPVGRCESGEVPARLRRGGWWSRVRWPSRTRGRTCQGWCRSQSGGRVRRGARGARDGFLGSPPWRDELGCRSALDVCLAGTGRCALAVHVPSATPTAHRSSHKMGTRGGGVLLLGVWWWRYQRMAWASALRRAPRAQPWWCWSCPGLGLARVDGVPPAQLVGSGAGCWRPWLP